MPVPTPRKDETRNDYVGRCMEFFAGEDTDLEQDQRLAICYERYRKWKRNRKKRAKAKERAAKLQESKSLVVELRKLKEYYDDKYRMGVHRCKDGM